MYSATNKSEFSMLRCANCGFKKVAYRFNTDGNQLQYETSVAKCCDHPLYFYIIGYDSVRNPI